MTWFWLYILFHFLNFAFFWNNTHIHSIHVPNLFCFCFLYLPHHFFSFFFILSNTGTESEVSFSLLNGSRNHNNRHSGLDNSTTTTSTRILMSPGTKPVKIAAISGKPRVQRYLSRECEWSFKQEPYSISTDIHSYYFYYIVYFI